MFFASDNWAGASKPVLDAVVAAMSSGPAEAYGHDPLTQRAERAISELFERECAVFLLASGTATNALAVAHVTPPWGAVYAHEEAHVLATECGAAEFYGGVKMVGIPGVGAKITPGALKEAIGRAQRGNAHSVQPATLSLTNLTEHGTLYTPAEIAALTAIAKAEGLAVHMDGARFANAVAALGCTPAEATWKVGVDVLSLGATKNGAVLAEAVVFFDPARAADFHYRRMRGGHLLSKSRFVAAQFEAWLADGHWLQLARHANAMAARLARGLESAGIALAWTPEGNEVFPILPAHVDAHLKEAGAVYRPWPSRGAARSIPAGAGVVRMVVSFSTTVEEVDRLVAEAHAAQGRARA